MRPIQFVPALVAALFLVACTENGTGVPSNIDPISLATAPPNAAPGTCWGKTVTPAVIETVTRKVMLHPAEISSDGQVRVPPVYKEETQHAVIKPRSENWYEVPCAADLTPEFISSVQRALIARGYYRGPVTGDMTARTKDAVQRYQKDQGLNSRTLSMAAARKLGLIAVERTIDG